MSLRKLIKAVEAGVISTDLIMAAIDEPSDQINALAAFDGYLDAAKALHEALLGGWNVYMNIPKGGAGCTVLVDTISPFRFYSAEADNPARAWLLAILRALEAEGR